MAVGVSDLSLYAAQVGEPCHRERPTRVVYGPRWGRHTDRKNHPFEQPTKGSFTAKDPRARLVQRRCDGDATHEQRRHDRPRLLGTRYEHLTPRAREIHQLASYTGGVGRLERRLCEKYRPFRF